MAKVLRHSVTITTTVYIIIAFIGIYSFGINVPELLTDIHIDTNNSIKIFFDIGKIAVALHILMCIPMLLLSLRE